jgi:hypothetical protein
MKTSHPAFTSLAFAALLACSVSGHAASSACPGPSGHGDAAKVVASVEVFRTSLSPEQRRVFEKPLTRTTAIEWSNLPIGVQPRTGLRIGDLDAAQAKAAHAVVEAAMSACGVKLFDEVRLADDVLLPLDKRKIGWSSANYYLSVLGTPGTKAVWMLQIGGHHLAYNLTFNGALPGATPLFFGMEPLVFKVKDAQYEPLRAQTLAMMKLSQGVAAHAKATLSGTFTDVVKGVVTMPGTNGGPPRGGIDSGYPHNYPTGDTDRGVRYDALSTAEQALVRTAIESYASFPGESITRDLLAAYLAPESLAATYVGVSGVADFSRRGSYVRIDGPRLWMEWIVQPAIALPDELHYHALWRDKQADYGGEALK